MFQLLLFFSFIVISLNEILLLSSSTNCSAGFHLPYPFGDPLKFGDNGYPALALKYLANRIVINVSDHLYRVQCIDHNRKLVTVVDVDIAEPDCPQPRRNVYCQYDHLLQLHQQYSYPNCGATSSLSRQIQQQQQK
ncbi:hypothetical protein IFM89_014128 [Coptis chinensis]|uniref:Uncharacterized protein n=1 Tax=Coptis chinensis TaxID=261450 RepID=A0A835LU96_9MAGN|nr:hypothetical protein IFM89_010343 [Coptis chinensis]KAF9605137.1 hypothetical protein IFM89_014128 [Coptis chinensis]